MTENYIIYQDSEFLVENVHDYRTDFYYNNKYLTSVPGTLSNEQSKCIISMCETLLNKTILDSMTC